MRLFDVNVLVEAHRRDAPLHQPCRACLDDPPEGQTLGFTMPVVAGFLRQVTHPRIWTVPTPADLALQAVAEWVQQPSSRWLTPGPRHWTVFDELCRRYRATGGAFYDLHLAALAIEQDCELWSLDHGFARVTELRWRSPAP